MGEIYRILIIIITFLTLVSCGRSEYSKVLTDADSLLGRHDIDSAEQALSAFAKDTTQATKPEKMYFALLELELQDKSRIPLRDLIKAQCLVQYFRNNGSRRLLAKALFYTGCTYRDLNDSPNALDYFQQSLEKSNGLRDYRLLESVYGEQGDLFLSQNLFKESAAAYKKYSEYIIKSNDSQRLPMAFLALARAYDEYGDHDKTLYYYRKAVSCAKQLNDSVQILNTELELCGTLQRYNMYQEAQKYIHHNPAFYLELADYYNEIDKRDSAILYYQQVIQNKDESLYNKMAATLSLGESYQYDNPSKSAVYFKQYILLDDSLETIKRSREVKQIEALYDYKLINKDRIQQQKINRKYKVIIIFVCMCIVCLATGTFFYYIYYKKKRDNEFLREHLLRMEKERKNQYSLQKLEQNKRQINLLKNLLEKAREERNQAQVEDLSLQKNFLETESKNIEEHQQRQKLLEKEMYACSVYIKLLHNLNSNTILLTEEEWTILKNAVNKTYNNFFERLSAFALLNDTEQKICYLLKLKIPLSDIANIICRSRAAVTLARIRLYKKITGKTGSAKDFDQFIHNF